MIKRILLISFLVLSVNAFSQERAVANLVASPNPFSTSTIISFESKQEQGVFLIVKNVLGKTVFRKGYYTTEGKKSIVFERNGLKPGMYIYAIQSENGVVSKRFVIK